MLPSIACTGCGLLPLPHLWGPLPHSKFLWRNVYLVLWPILCYFYFILLVISESLEPDKIQGELIWSPTSRWEEYQNRHHIFTFYRVGTVS